MQHLLDILLFQIAGDINIEQIFKDLSLDWTALQLQYIDAPLGNDAQSIVQRPGSMPQDQHHRDLVCILLSLLP
jgi:hypothetical protein